MGMDDLLCMLPAPSCIAGWLTHWLIHEPLQFIAVSSKREWGSRWSPKQVTRSTSKFLSNFISYCRKRYFSMWLFLHIVTKCILPSVRYGPRVSIDSTQLGLYIRSATMQWPCWPKHIRNILSMLPCNCAFWTGSSCVAARKHNLDPQYKLIYFSSAMLVLCWRIEEYRKNRPLEHSKTEGKDGRKYVSYLIISYHSNGIRIWTWSRISVLWFSQILFEKSVSWDSWLCLVRFARIVQWLLL